MFTDLDRDDDDGPGYHAMLEALTGGPQMSSRSSRRSRSGLSARYDREFGMDPTGSRDLGGEHILAVMTRDPDAPGQFGGDHQRVLDAMTGRRFGKSEEPYAEPHAVTPRVRTSEEDQRERLLDAMTGRGSY